jgi:MFS transporter, DHA2 family, multidrug resistance protein
MSPPGSPVLHQVTWRDWIGFMAMVFGMFMAILDIQIVSASIDTIQAGLSASPDEASWVQTSYLMAEIVMIPLSGWLSRLLSTRILFCISAGGFTLFSVLCATAGSLGEMVVFRALQGFIGGAMIPTVFTATFLLFHGPKRVQMNVLIGLTATLAPTVGPTLGGWLSDQFSWHWLFLINVPVGAAITVTVWRFLSIDKANWELRRSFDLMGLTLMALFLGSLEYVLEEGNRNDWFGDQTITTFAVVSAAAGILFFWRMLTRNDPLVELRAFANRNFASGCFFSFVVGIGLYGSVFVVPLFLGRVRVYSSLQIGETMFITGLAMFLGAPIAGQLAARVDPRRMLAAGLAMFGVSLYWLGHLTNQSAFWEFFWPQALRGFSIMFVMLPTNTIALTGLTPQQLKNASGLYNLMRNLGGAVGLAIINTMISSRLALHRQHLDEAVTWSRPAVGQMIDQMSGALSPYLQGDAQTGALRRIAFLVEREALTLTYNDMLILMSMAFFIALPLTLFLARPGAGSAPEGAH